MPPEKETPSEEVRRSLKTQQHAHISAESSVEECVQVRRRRLSIRSAGRGDGGAKIDPVLRPELAVYFELPRVGARA